MFIYRTIIVAMSCAFISLLVHGQGQIEFNTSVVHARVTYPDGTPVGPDFSGQLMLVPAGSSLAPSVPLFPIGTFSNPLSLTKGYVSTGVPVTVPGYTFFTQPTVFLRAYNGSTWETSSYRGESSPISVLLGGGTMPPGELFGLQPFSVYPVPEPSTLDLFGIALFIGTGLSQPGREFYARRMALLRARTSHA